MSLFLCYQVQHEVLLKRQKEKKEMMQQVKKFRKGSSGDGFTLLMMGYAQLTVVKLTNYSPWRGFFFYPGQTDTIDFLEDKTSQNNKKKKQDSNKVFQ